MLVSWPLTSGATRISVTRTTPTMGAATLERHTRYPPAPAATKTRATAIMVTGLLAMRLSPLDEECGYHCEREIDDRQNPQTAPVARYAPHDSAKLAYAHDSINCETSREYVIRG